MILTRRLHLKRYRQIISVLVRNGFGLLLEQLGIFGYLRLRHHPLDPASAKAAENARLSIGERLRRSCEELGPTFIKIGQILSTRPDIFSPEIAGELEKLQDAVNPFPYIEVRKVIEEEFGAPLESVFQTFEEQPLAAASLSQVHKATLPTGHTVVVKVQRPGIQSRIQIDLEVLQDLVSFVCNRTHYGELYDFAGMMAELEKTLKNELDFRKEGINADIFRQNLKARKGVSVPIIRWIYTTSRVLTMEYIEGIRINQLEQLDAAGIDRSELGIRLSQDMCSQVLEDGFFHADPHPGNLSIQPDGTIVYLDLGMVGKLTESRKKTLSKLFVGIFAQDSHQVVEAIVDLDKMRQRGSIRRFEREVDRLMEQFLALPIAEIQVGPLLAQIFQLAYRYHIQIPGELTLIAKVMITLQGITEKLDPELNLLVIMKPIASKLIRDTFSIRDMSREIHRNLTDYQALLQQAPTFILELMHRLEDDDFNLHFDLKNIDKVQRHFDRISNRLSFSVILLAVSIIIAGIIIGSSLNASSGPEMHELNLIILRFGLAIAGVILLGLIISIFRTKKF